MQEDRILWIDVAKGIGIFAIVLGHCSSGNLQYFCFSFNSVIFFILAGITFCRKKTDTDDYLSFDAEKKVQGFLSEKIRTLLIPYLFWGLISIFIYSVLGKITTSTLGLSEANFSIGKNIFSLLYGNSETGYFEWNRPLWFLPCLFLVECLWFIALKVVNYYSFNIKQKCFVYVMVMLCSIINLIFLSFNEYKFVLPFELETALGMLFFFGIGLILRNKIFLNFLKYNIYNRKKNTQIIIVFCGIICTTVLVILNGRTDTRADYYSNIFFYIVNALLASCFLIWLSKIIFRNRLLEYIGTRTMAILVMHKFPIMFLKVLLPVVNEKILEGNIFVEVFVAFFSIMSCLVVEKLLGMIVPEVFGKKRTK